MHFAQFGGQVRWRHAVTHPPTGGVEGLAERENGEAAFPQFGVRQYRVMASVVEHYVLIDFIGKHRYRPVAYAGRKRIEILRAHHRATGVLRAVDDDQPCARAQVAPYFIPVEAKCRRRQSDPHAASPGQTYRGLVSIIGGIENDDFVAVADNCLYRVEQRFGAATGHGNFRLRIEAACVNGLEFGCDALA